MSNTNINSMCLHVPELVCGNTARLSWEAVEGVVGYSLEVCFDTIYGDSLSVGESWLCIETKDMTWSQVNANLMSWQEIEAMPESHIVFKGAGTDIESPDGDTWEEILNTLGLSWDSVDSKYMEFDLIELSNNSWDDLENEEPHIGTHITCDVDIPINARYAIFRIRAFEMSGNVLSTLQTMRISITTSQTIDVPPLQEMAMIQIEGNRVDANSEMKYRLRYDPALLNSMLRRKQQHFELGQTEELWTGVKAVGDVISKTNKSANLQFDWYQTS